MHAAVTTRALLVVIASLVVLTLLSWGASLLHLPGPLEVAVALGIAAVKVSLVGLFFMELKAHDGAVRFVAVAGPLFIALLTVMILADVLTR